MKKTSLALAALSVGLAPLSPAYAGWKLVPGGTSAMIAKSKLAVTPGEAWNRWSSRPIKKSEVWTLDGAALNELYFVSGLIAGEPLYREANKKDNPLPKMKAGMQLTEIPEFFESSNRVALATSVFQVTGSEPTQFSGQPGVKFTYEYAISGSTLTRKGIAAATVVNNTLYLISFTAPSTYYFDRDRQKVEAIMASARF